MTLLFADSFDHYNTSQLARKWDGVSSANCTIASGGRNGTNCYQPIGGCFLTKNLTANAGTIIVGGAIKLATAVDQSYYLKLMDNTTVQTMFFINTDGSISAYNGSGTLLGSSAPGVLTTPFSVYNYVEVKVLFHASAGTVEIRVNGSSTPVLNLTGKVTAVSGNAYINRVQLARDQPNANMMVMWDDFYICDTAGSTNNTFLGDTRVECVLPSGAGNSAQFTASAGSNYQCVDENPANDDTDYVSSSNVGDKDTYAMTNLSSTSGTVKAVCVTSVDRKDDSGARTHSHVVRLSGSESTGTAFSPTTSYSVHQTPFETKPGGGAWTITDVNNAEAGLTIAS